MDILLLFQKRLVKSYRYRGLKDDILMKERNCCEDMPFREDWVGHTSKQCLFYERVDGSVVYLQSSYEIEFASLLDEIGVHWERPSPLTWIDTNDVRHRYYPDFKIGSVYIDTKNDYLAIKDLPKIMAVRDQNGVDVRIVTKDLITKEFIATLV